MADLIVILASVTAVSLVAFIGILFIGLKEAFLKRVLMALIGFASGSLIGGAFIHLLPESLEETGQAMFYYVIVGIVFLCARIQGLYSKVLSAQAPLPRDVEIRVSVVGPDLPSAEHGAPPKT